ncbi:hypothetical protein QVD17_08423 [Tagetes erecta]|uniref:Uncharacterized protein n=1 Tax=Tagetes erecta TaxID=13708 RepID=A0AAD8L2X7_TARER|nr:hypothetical protein QVD17_08423 [Tagetes erecta]
MPAATSSVINSPFHGVIDVSYGETTKVKKVSGSRKRGDAVHQQHIERERMDGFKFHSSNTRSAKRKKAAKIIISDDESGYEGNAPIGTHNAKHSSSVMIDSEEEGEENLSKRKHTRLRKLGSKNKQDKSSIYLNKTFSSSEDEEDGVADLESEGESLGGFIVDSSENASEKDSESG